MRSPATAGKAVASLPTPEPRRRSVLATAEKELLEAARKGDERAFERLVEPHRSLLNAHCYRMLGSLHDAEDALQDALLRAWRGLRGFDGRSALRSWLYRIATNTCLDLIGRRPKRVLPIDYGPPSDPHDWSDAPLVESVWVEPYPDEALGIADGFAAPDARYEMRESVELAFVAALQHLPATQRAVLILRDVLSFSAQETADSLATTVASANSALQRARKTLDDRLPERSQQATLRSIGDERMREIVEAYMAAMKRGDVDAVVGMLAEDAAWSMPPITAWIRGLDGLRVFLGEGPLSGKWRWRHLPVRANGQWAVGAYTWVEEAGAHLPFALDVLTFEGERIKEVTAFITRISYPPGVDGYARWPEYEADPDRVRDIFERFGLPPRID